MLNTHTTLTSLFTDIANKIRAKKGTSASIKADDFPSEIESIQTGITPSGSQTFTQNGTYDVTAIAQAIVNVSGGFPSGMDYGIFTMSANWNLNSDNKYEILHNLGLAPTHFFLIDITLGDRGPLGALTAASYIEIGVLSGNVAWNCNSSNDTNVFRGASYGAVEVSPTSIFIGAELVESAYTYNGKWLLSGRTYLWVAINNSEVSI